MSEDNQPIEDGQLQYLHSLSHRDPIYDHLRKKSTLSFKSLKLNFVDTRMDLLN